MSLKSRIPAIRRKLPDALVTAVERSGVMVADVAAQLVPVDTSALKRTIRVNEVAASGASAETTVTAGDPSASRPTDGKPVNYAPYVEHGTSTSAAQPFMTPAAQAIKPAIEVAKEVKKVLR